MESKNTILVCPFFKLWVANFYSFLRLMLLRISSMIMIFITFPFLPSPTPPMFTHVYFLSNSWTLCLQLFYRHSLLNSFSVAHMYMVFVCSKGWSLGQPNRGFFLRENWLSLSQKTPIFCRSSPRGKALQIFSYPCWHVDAVVILHALFRQPYCWHSIVF